MVTKVILNLLPIVSGGGKQNCLSFLNTLADSHRRDDCLALFRQDDSMAACCQDGNIEYLSVRQGVLSRLKFEVACRSRFTESQVCFTLFGPAMLRAPGYLLNVNGCAYSNLFYPEIAFWNQSGRRRIFHECKDLFRRRQTQAADYWIFETEVLRQRAVELCHFPPERVGVVRMAPSMHVRPEAVQPDVCREFESRLPKAFRFLHLCGAHPNKRLVQMARIVRVMKENGGLNVCAVFTMPTDSSYARLVRDSFRSEGVEDCYVNVGPILPKNVASLIATCQAMCTFSILESFSNNFVEAWLMQRPLVVTDADWAHAACGNAALYVNPNDPLKSANTMLSLVRDQRVCGAMVKNGCRQLATYPSAAEKLERYFEQIGIAVGLGRCPKKLRERIKWPRTKKDGT